MLPDDDFDVVKAHQDQLKIRPVIVIADENYGSIIEKFEIEYRPITNDSINEVLHTLKGYKD